MPNVLITGASRGLGLGFAEYYAAQGWNVVACARDVTVPALQQLAANSNVELHTLDVTDHKAIENLAAVVGPLDLFINNAGVSGQRGVQSFGKIDYNDWRQVLEVNTFAPVKLAEVLAPKLSPQSKVVMISSRMGSISDASTDSYAYRTSKTALNMVTKLLAADLAPRGVIVAALHPGWVQTDMGGSGAQISVEASIKGMTGVIANLQPADTGCFKNYKGEVLPW
jgi:NAD(P)-dependent dehydrogenase (short-subunit alcohol dehydrogenase family)